MTTDDMELVRQYAANQSESAFAALVSRHANLVYSAALRRTANPQLAEEITQAVFIILARKAGALNDNTIISGWLYRTACYVSGHAFKQELRRQQREQEAYMQSLSNQTESEVWPQIMPLLEDAMLRLGQTDRDALVLHFFEGRNLKEVGAIIGTSEAATKMRVNRAVEKLQKFFLKRGVTSTTATLAGAISANSVHAAPAALIKTTTAVALAKGAAGSTSTLTIAKGALKIMAWIKAKTAIVVGVAAILAAGTTTTLIVLHKLDRWEIISLKRINYDRSDPKGALFFMRRALVSGDANGYVDSFQLTDQDGALRDSLKQMVQSFAELHRVLAVKFGEASANVVIKNTAPGLMPKEMIDSAQAKADGGRMQISFGEAKNPKAMIVLELVQSNGNWQLNPESLFRGASKENITQTMIQCAAVIQNIIPEVQKGTYPDAGAVGLAIKHEMN